MNRGTTAALAAIFLCATSAHAIDKCKVKVSKKTGIIEVSATGVGGPLLWGAESGSESNPFDNAGSCLDGDKAKKCNLADPLTVAAKTPPADCTLYLDDGVAACSAWIPGCVPGSRDSAAASVPLLLDANDAVIGPMYGDSAVLVDVGESKPAAIPVASSFGVFSESGSQTRYFESADCSGAALFYAYSPDSVVVAGTVADGVFYYPSGPVSSLTFNSYARVGASHTDSATCLSLWGATFGTWVAPDRCCYTGVVTPFEYPFAAPGAFDLSGFVEPLRLQ